MTGPYDPYNPQPSDPQGNPGGYNPDYQGVPPQQPFNPAPSFGAPNYGAPFNAPAPGAGSPGELLPRFGARLLDGLIIVIPAAIIGKVIGGNAGSVIELLLFAVGYLAYNVYFDTTTGQTLGKKLVGVRINGPQGGPLTSEQSLKRNVVFVLPCIGTIAFIVGAIQIGTSPDKRGFHDSMAGGTFVSKV